MVRIHGKNGEKIAPSEVGLFRGKEPEALQKLFVLILIIKLSFIYRFPSIDNISKEGQYIILNIIGKTHIGI
jgi:hypothetical protein